MTDTLHLDGRKNLQLWSQFRTAEREATDGIEAEIQPGEPVAA
jgi:hypothetical protein